MNQNEIQTRLKSLQDIQYQQFQSRLMPTINPQTIIGVRVPLIRKFAAELAKKGGNEEFLHQLPHEFYEENNLHAFLIEKITDFEECVRAIDEFLPYVDNWATCDSMSPKIFKKHTADLLPHIERWIASDKTYTIRFGIEMLMSWFLEEHFEPRFLEMVAQIRSEEYYVNMMIAWYFATALAKQYEATMPFIEHKLLSDWCHNKTIQKAVESYRITDEQKSYLRSLKVAIEKK